MSDAKRVDVSDETFERLTKMPKRLRNLGLCGMV